MICFQAGWSSSANVGVNNPLSIKPFDSLCAVKPKSLKFKSFPSVPVLDISQGSYPKSLKAKFEGEDSICPLWSKTFPGAQTHW